MKTGGSRSDPASALVVIGGSAGAIGSLDKILSRLPADFPAAVVVVQHSDSNRRSLLAPILAQHTALSVRIATDGDALLAGHVYVVPPDRHCGITPERRIHLFDGARIRHVRSSANPLFESAAAVYGDRVVAVVLSGSGMDATDGVQAVKARGGAVIVQDALSARHYGMPGSAIATGAVDYVLPIEHIPDTLSRLSSP